MEPILEAPNTDDLPGGDEGGLALDQQSGAGEAGQAGGSAPEESDWDPKSWEMNYQGTKMYPKDRQHLINLAQQGYGYSKNMEQIKRERAELEQQRGVLDRYAPLDQALQQNPELGNQIWNLVQQQQLGVGQQGQQGYQEGEQGQVPPEVLSKLQEFDEFRNSYEAKQADQALETELSELRREHPQDPWDVDDGQGTLQEKVIQHALESNITDLRVAYRDLMWPQLEARTKAEALAQAQKDQKSAKRKGIVDNGVPAKGPQDGKSGYKSGDSYQDLVNKAISSV